MLESARPQTATGTSWYDAQPIDPHPCGATKRRRYQRAGVPEYWVVDLDAHLIERWRPANPRPEILDDRFALSLHPHGGALDIDVAKFFADLRGDR